MKLFFGVTLILAFCGCHSIRHSIVTYSVPEELGQVLRQWTPDEPADALTTFLSDAGFDTSQLSAEPDGASGIPPRFQISTTTDEHVRLRNLVAAFENYEEREDDFLIEIDMYKVPAALGRRWGLDGLPATEQLLPELDLGPGAHLKPNEWKRLREALSTHPAVESLIHASGYSKDGGRFWADEQYSVPAPFDSWADPKELPDDDEYLWLAEWDQRFGLLCGVLALPMGYYEAAHMGIEVYRASPRMLRLCEAPVIDYPMRQKLNVETSISTRANHTVQVACTLQTTTAHDGTTSSGYVLLFVTPRYLHPPPTWPEPSDYGGDEMDMAVVEGLYRGFAVRGGKHFNGEQPKPLKDVAAKLKTLLAEYGVNFPPGSRFALAEGRLVLLSTKADVQHLRDILLELDGWEFWSDGYGASVALLECSSETWRHIQENQQLLPGQVLTSAQAQELMHSPPGDVKVVAYAGQCAEWNTLTKLQSKTEIPKVVEWLYHEGRKVPALLDEPSFIGLEAEFEPSSTRATCRVEAAYRRLMKPINSLPYSPVVAGTEFDAQVTVTTSDAPRVWRLEKISYFSQPEGDAPVRLWLSQAYSVPLPSRPGQSKTDQGFW